MIDFIADNQNNIVEISQMFSYFAYVAIGCLMIWALGTVEIERG